MILILRVFGWLGIASSGFNAAIKLFANDEAVRRYAGIDRDLDLNISIAAFCLLFLALASILAEVRALNKTETNQ
ncbi:hypothetical protein ROA7450_03367 [Roseovarius albus]|uniref:Uncharacterized protein n=1 Tax=Roseovarius albus TaxID=1247867 RepID=A0A1X6ZZ39_9RHOB|nr:hypothetical protein [Roseovarius albus]SLN63984.1 hypothetical protein ROA7450_03367 [Roseovarius albus]